MTNDEISPKSEIPLGCSKREATAFMWHGPPPQAAPWFGIRHSDFFRHSSFVIRHFQSLMLAVDVFPPSMRDSHAKRVRMTRLLPVTTSVSFGFGPKTAMAP